ncbi:MAG: hypothetical protein IPJ88_14400 [Myxococcales bacterium]|nr:MAG: hypothetical protein IPJ88_14400 [Myxococcales bacterium]
MSVIFKHTQSIRRACFWLCLCLFFHPLCKSIALAQGKDLPEWRQVLALSRFNARLTAVAADPTDPRRIYVGTELGTVFKTEDGGVVWSEREIFPYSNGNYPAIPLAEPTYMTGYGFNLKRAPFMVLGVDREIVRRTPYDVGTSLWLSVRPDVVHRNLPSTVRSGNGDETLLKDEFAKSRDPKMPVIAMAVCPGATLPLIVATKKHIFGSFDDGETFIRVFGVPLKNNITWINCSSSEPNEMAATTDMGLFRSRDGGVSWDEDVLFWPGREALSVTYAAGLDGRETIYVATGGRLYKGALDEWDRQSWKYPTYYKVYYTPWANVNWATATDDGVIWIGTSEGVRISRDGGDNWDIGGNSMYERESIKQLVHGRDDSGKEMIAIVTDRRGYAVDNEGTGHLPFHEGFSLRNIHRVATIPSAEGQKGKWWVLTGSELWTNVKMNARRNPSRSDFMRWAKLRQRFTPPLSVLIDTVYENFGVSANQMAKMFRDSWRGTYLPKIDIQAEYRQFDWDRNKVVSITAPAIIDSNIARNDFFFVFQLHWRLGELGFSDHTTQFMKHRAAFDKVRSQLRETMEDSWYEREQHLKTLTMGQIDPFQSEVLRTRIECLEALFEVWTRGKYWNSALEAAQNPSQSFSN